MKAYAPHVLTAIGESLRLSYWYRNDLKSFLLRVGVPPEAVRGLPWTESKRAIVGELLDTLSGKPGSMEIVDRIVGSLVEQDENFPHLRRAGGWKGKGG